MLVLRKVKQLLSNFEAERWENLSNLRLAKKSVAYKKNSSVCSGFRCKPCFLRVLLSKQPLSEWVTLQFMSLVNKNK